jgi:hypothetical protein
VDLLESTHSRRSNRVVVVLPLSVIAAAVIGLLAVTVHSPRAGQHAARLPSPNVSTGVPVGRANGPASAAATKRLFVFVEPLDQCTSTDHYRHLRIALDVSNLNNQPIRIVSATAVGPSPALRLTRVQLGALPCAELTRRVSTLLPSSDEVVALNFGVGPGCPSDHSIDVRVTFAVGGSRLHSDTLVGLTGVNFRECASA